MFDELGPEAHQAWAEVLEAARKTHCLALLIGVNPLWRDGRMHVLGTLGSALLNMLRRRRLHWVEISVERAWSHDMAPRLFDLS